MPAIVIATVTLNSWESWHAVGQASLAPSSGVLSTRVTSLNPHINLSVKYCFPHFIIRKLRQIIMSKEVAEWRLETKSMLH